MSTITRLLDKHAKYADRLWGSKATLRHRTYGGVDVATGVQSYTESSSEVKVRSWPLSIMEQVNLAQAGLDRVDTRWTLRCAYSVDISSDDILTVNNFHYEILASSATKDEHGVEWTLLTRRRPN